MAFGPAIMRIAHCRALTGKLIFLMALVSSTHAEGDAPRQCSLRWLIIDGCFF
jgi:hypothetical protein